MIKIKRILKAAFVNFIRNGWLSLTATLIMTLAVLTVGVFLLLFLSTNKIVSELKDKVDIVVNFKDSASEQVIQQLKNELLTRDQIKSVRYISKEEALKEFKSRRSVKVEVRQLVTPEDNPLPRGLQIQSVDFSEFEYVSNLIKSPAYASYIDSSSYDDNKQLIESINSSTKFIQNFGVGLSLFFIAVAVLVVFNTVRLAVVFRSKEIEVMRLVGGSEVFVKYPFLIEGCFYAILAVIISSILIFFAISILEALGGDTIFEQFAQRMIPIYYEEFWFITLVQFLIAFIIGVGASSLSLRRNVKI